MLKLTTKTALLTAAVILLNIYNLNAKTFFLGDSSKDIFGSQDRFESDCPDGGKICESPAHGIGRECNGKYEACACPNVYNKTCEGDYKGMGKECNGKYIECACKHDNQVCKEEEKCTEYVCDGNVCKGCECKPAYTETCEGDYEGVGSSCSGKHESCECKYKDNVCGENQYCEEYACDNKYCKKCTDNKVDDEEEEESTVKRKCDDCEVCLKCKPGEIIVGVFTVDPERYSWVASNPLGDVLNNKALIPVKEKRDVLWDQRYWYYHIEYKYAYMMGYASMFHDVWRSSGGFGPNKPNNSSSLSVSYYESAKKCEFHTVYLQTPVKPGTEEYEKNNFGKIKSIEVEIYQQYTLDGRCSHGQYEVVKIGGANRHKLPLNIDTSDILPNFSYKASKVSDGLWKLEYKINYDYDGDIVTPVCDTGPYPPHNETLRRVFILYAKPVY